MQRGSFSLWICETTRAATLLVALFAPTLLYGQVDTGSLLGTVKDQSGAVIPGAGITVVDEGTNFVYNTTTGSDGGFVFTPIKIGTYSVSAEALGFQKTTHVHVVVNIQQQSVVDLTLTPGKVTQRVVVTAAPPLLQTQNASVQQVVTTRTINDLPLNGRNATFLAQISAGVTFGPQDSRGLGASGAFSANGARGNQNNYMMDGIDNNSEVGDLINRTNYVVLPPPDALDEFTVQTNNYSAEFGHSAGAVLNTTTKTGTNELHGNIWEFLRNDKLDATDFFLNKAGVQKGEFRQNQFGFTLGGPIVLPRIYNGRNKTFLFAFYQGIRIRQGSTQTATVPTAAERNSGYTNFQDLITGQSGKPRTDLLGRSFPLGAILDPGTTRAVTKDQLDPVTGLVASADGFVRDPFFNGSLNGLKDFTTPGAISLLNLIRASRLDPNSTKLLNLYPLPTTTNLFDNFTSAPVNRDDNDQFGIRADHNFSGKDTMFVRWIFSKSRNDFPGPFPGLADGQPDRPGSGTTKAQNWALSETHIFSSNLVNEARIGYSRLHDVRLQFDGNDLTNIPEQFGIQGIPQVPENGGLPRFSIGGLGTGQFLPSDKWSNTLQATENLTKIAGRHSLKTGFEFQNIRFPLLTPPNSRGQFTSNGVFTSVVNQTDGTTGRAQFLLTPIPSTVPGGVNNVGGFNQVIASNIAPFADLRRNYYATYVQDDWRVYPKLTLNLGLRWEYFGRPMEHFDAIANFIPGSNFQGGQFLFPARRKKEVPQAFIDQLAKDNIIFTPTNGSPWQKSSRGDFGPRFGFAYRLKSKLVVRGGYAIFYGGAETLGLSSFGANNFPFLVSSSFNNPNPTNPITPDNSIGTLENGLLNVPLSASSAKTLSGISLIGAQFHWKDAGTQNYNFFVEHRLSAYTTAKAGYSGSQTRHLLITLPANTVAQILPPGVNLQKNVFYPDLGQGGSIQTASGNANYNALLLNIEHRAADLSLLSNFTWSKCRNDGRDPLINDIGGNRAPYLAGFGIQGDYGLCNFDVRRIFHFSGVYNLPFGRGRRFLNKSGVLDYLLGGWSTNWIATVQDGQPFTIGCTIATTSGLGCNALVTPGQDPTKRTPLSGGDDRPDQFLNPAAFANPPVATMAGQADFAPLGGAPTQVTGPPFHRLDLSFFKKIRTTERTHLEFRAEFFNLTNTPNFALPSRRNFTDTANFGKITSTRDNPNDPREIQFALKFYF